ncbi:MAG TPA: sodium:solute symporter family protein [Vicinamibacterales bacterium]|nr:sodium:solute symporter family protein [Vicinamibacterales bacterium]
MIADQNVLIWVTLIYFAVVIGVSVFFRRASSEVEFLAAGRTIGPWVGGAVLAATQISAGTFVGTLGRSYLTGVSWMWVWFGVWSGWVTSAVLVAPKLRRFGALTVADYVGTRFASEGARTLAAALIIVCYSILLTAQFQAIGEIASAVFGISPLLAMTALLASTGFYTAIGGVRASSYIEFIQTLIMVLALVCAVPVVFVHVGGFTPLGEYIGSIDARITGQWFSWRELLAFSLAFGLGIAAAPYEMTRYYSMRDVATVRYAIGVSMILQLIIGACVATLGMGMRGVFPFLPSPDQASSIMASTVMPPLLGSLFVVAMLSAIMSTVNSILLVTGGAFAHDLYKRLVNKEASQQRLVWVNRLSIVILGIIPFWFAQQRLGDVQTIVIEQAKFIASFFFVPVVMGLNWRRGTREGAIWSMAMGFLACLVWTFTLQHSFSRHGIDSVEVGVIASALTFVIVSRLTPPTPKKNLAIFFDGEEGA